MRNFFFSISAIIPRELIAAVTFLFLFVNEVPAQKATLNDQGEKVIVFEDGSWRYFNENSAEDMALWYAYLKENEPPPSKILPKDQERLNEAEAYVKQATNNYQGLVLERLLIEEKLNTNSALLNKQDRERLEGKQKEFQTQEKTAKKQLDEAKALFELAEKIAEAEEKNKNKLIASYNDVEKGYQKKYQLFTSNGTSKSFFYDNAPKTLKKYSEKLDVMVNPPAYPCEISFGGSQRNIELPPRRFFEFTSEKMRPFLDGKSFITAEAFLSQVDRKIYTLTLTITIASQFAQEEFGFIKKGSPLALNLIDGNRVVLNSLTGSQGQLNENGESVTYSTSYVIDNYEKKILTEAELSSIRFIWSTGYEDYPIHEMDFFIDQFNCLDQRD